MLAKLHVTRINATAARKPSEPLYGIMLPTFISVSLAPGSCFLTGAAEGHIAHDGVRRELADLANALLIYGKGGYAWMDNRISASAFALTAPGWRI
jgi:hypothetical protein